MSFHPEIDNNIYVAQSGDLISTQMGNSLSVTLLKYKQGYLSSFCTQVNQVIIQSKRSLYLDRRITVDLGANQKYEEKIKHV